jgi:hypothetical protein
VAEDGVLQLELRHAPTSEHSEQSDSHEVGEGSQSARMLHAIVNQGGTEFWTPQDHLSLLLAVAPWRRRYQQDALSQQLQGDDGGSGDAERRGYSGWFTDVRLDQSRYRSTGTTYHGDPPSQRG